MKMLTDVLDERDAEIARLREALAATTAMCRSATTWPADDIQGLRYHALERAKIGMAALDASHLEGE